MFIYFFWNLEFGFKSNSINWIGEMSNIYVHEPPTDGKVR